MAQKAKKQVAAKGSMNSSQMTLWLSVAFVAVVILSLPSIIIIFFGMLPSTVAFIIDRSKQRNTAFCVGGINFCGVFPYLMDLWSGSNTIDLSVKILTDVFSLIVMYGAAGFGWLVYLSLPPVIAAFLSVMAQHRLTTLRATQRQLIEEWGEDVSTPQDVLDMRDEIAASDESNPDDQLLDMENFLEGIDGVLNSSAPAPADDAASKNDSPVHQGDATKQSAAAGA